MAGTGYRKGTTTSRLIHINSNDRAPGQGGDRSTNFVINLGNNLHDCLAISYKSCKFPNNIYNVRGPTSYNLNYNNQLFYQTISGYPPIGTPLTPGFYNASSLMQAIIDQIVALDAFVAVTDVINFTISPITGLITLTFTSSTNGANFIKNKDQDPAFGGTVGYFGPWELLGFTSPFNLAVGASVTAATLPSLGGVTSVYLRSAALSPSNGYLTDGSIVNSFQAINITAPFMGLNSDECKVDSLCEIAYSPPRRLNTIDLKLTDHDGNEVNLNGGTVALELRGWFNTLI